MKYNIDENNSGKKTVESNKKQKNHLGQTTYYVELSAVKNYREKGGGQMGRGRLKWFIKSKKKGAIVRCTGPRKMMSNQL